MLTVNDLMTFDPDAVSPDVPLSEVVAKMNRDGCRQLPVVEDGKLVGIVTDRDVRLAVNSPIIEEEHTVRHEERAELLHQLVVASCMTVEPMTVTTDLPAREAADLLALYKFGALPVVDDGKLVGIISVTDFLRHMASRE
jgi:acetoin utilization protein AcuB